MGAKTSLLVLIVLTVVLGLLRADCSGPIGGRKRVELSFWNGWTGPDGRVALEMIREFNRSNPDVEVSMQRMDWATYYNKLMVAAVDGRGPEVFVIHASTLPRMQRAGFVGNVDNLLEGADCIPPNDFDPYVLEQTKYGRDYVGVPLDIHPQGLYLNRDLLKQAGFDHPPRNADEFVRAARAMQKDEDGDGRPDQWGFALTLWRNNFQALMPQFGGRYLDGRGRAVLDSPQNIAALEFMGRLQKQHLVPPPENGLGWVGFRQKKVGMVFDGVYMLGDLQRLDDLHYVGAPIPQIGPKPGTMADSHVLCIRKDLDSARRSAAERFIRFLSAHSVDWARAGQVPARKSARATAAFKAMPVQSAFARQIPYMLYPPRTTVLFELSTELDLAVEKVMRGRATAAEALKVANTNVQRFLDRDAEERRVEP